MTEQIARLSQDLRSMDFSDHRAAYDAAVTLRRLADQIENSAIQKELRSIQPWWEDPDPGVRVSR